MAGPLSPAACVKSTRNDYGPDHGPNSPTSFWAVILDGDPEFDGVELDPSDCPGYARQAVSHAAFTVVTEGVEVVVTGFEATGPWAAVGKVVLLLSADDETEGWDYAFVQPIKVTGAGPLDPLRFTVYYSADSTIPG